VKREQCPAHVTTLFTKRSPRLACIFRLDMLYCFHMTLIPIPVPHDDLRNTGGAGDEILRERPELC